MWNLGKTAVVVVCGNFPALSSIGSVVASFVRALYQLCPLRLEGGILVVVSSWRVGGLCPG